MTKQTIGIGLLGLGTVGTGVVKIINSPEDRNPLVSNIKIEKVAGTEKTYSCQNYSR